LATDLEKRVYPYLGKVGSGRKKKKKKKKISNRRKKSDYLISPIQG